MTTSPGLVIPVSSIDVTENSKETDKGNTASYTVSLNHRPSADVAVAVSVSGDDSLSVSRVSLTFTSSDWSVPQTVTVTAATDGDLVNGTATIQHSASGGGFDGVSGVVAATEIDDSGEIKDPWAPDWVGCSLGGPCWSLFLRVSSCRGRVRRLPDELERAAVWRRDHLHGFFRIPVMAAIPV